jgi:hypothetical protein
MINYLNIPSKIKILFFDLVWLRSKIMNMDGIKWNFDQFFFKNTTWSQLIKNALSDRIKNNLL